VTVELAPSVANDNTPPTVNVADKSVYTYNSSSVRVSFLHDVSVTDDVSGHWKADSPIRYEGTEGPTCSPASGTIFPVGTTTVTCTASDAAGNKGTASFTVTVIILKEGQPQPPPPEAPSSMKKGFTWHGFDDITKQTADQNGSSATFNSYAIDIASSVWIQNCNYSSGYVFQIGTTEVVCTATDSSGNTDSNSFNVTIEYTGTLVPNMFVKDYYNYDAENSIECPGCELTSASISKGGGKQGAFFIMRYAEKTPEEIRDIFNDSKNHRSQMIRQMNLVSIHNVTEDHIFGLPPTCYEGEQVPQPNYQSMPYKRLACIYKEDVMIIVSTNYGETRSIMKQILDKMHFYQAGSSTLDAPPPPTPPSPPLDEFVTKFDPTVSSLQAALLATSEFCDNGEVWKDGKCQKNIPEVRVAESDSGNVLGEASGCLIATAAFGSEMAPQVQLLREIRDNTVLQTESGTSFMAGFNQFYYSFSPYIADYERENPAFKETVKIALTPLLTSLTLLQYVDIDSESEMLGYGIGVILLNIGMYFVAPAVLIMAVRKRI
jgi:hypothetical protein